MLSSQVDCGLPSSAVGDDCARVAVLGLGYVGWPVASTFAEAGFRVVGIDVDPNRVAALQRSEDGAASARALRTGRLSVTTERVALESADVVFICVPTPLEEGEAVHAAVRECAAAFARHGRPDALVVLESTVRPGFVAALRPLLGHGGRVALAYAPERIDPQLHQSGWQLRDVPRLVAGVDDDAQTRALVLLRAVGVDVHPVALPVAEYAKLLENSYRLVNVALINEFAALCRADGIDPVAVVRAAATKPYGYQPFWPGVGAGGHCVAVDPAFLAQRGQSLGVPFPLLESALLSNASRPRAIAASLAAQTGAGETILVVGLTYKAGVPDTRESAALAAAHALVGMNRRVLVFDPLVPPPEDLEFVALVDGLARATSAVLLVAQSDDIVATLLASGLTLFDVTGTLAGAVEV